MSLVSWAERSNWAGSPVLGSCPYSAADLPVTAGTVYCCPLCVWPVLSTRNTEGAQPAL